MKRLISVFVFLCFSNASFSSENDLINTLLIAKNDIYSEVDAGNEIIYKGIYFYLDGSNIVSREENRFLLKNVVSYPYHYIINGWIDLNDFITTKNARKVVVWPFKTWKKDMLFPVNHIFDFEKNGSVKYYSDDEGTQYTGKLEFYGHIYLVEDIVIVMEENGKVFPIAIYDDRENILCPIGKPYKDCKKYLNSTKKYRDFYLEKFKGATYSVETVVVGDTH